MGIRGPQGRPTVGSCVSNALELGAPTAPRVSGLPAGVAMNGPIPWQAPAMCYGSDALATEPSLESGNGASTAVRLLTRWTLQRVRRRTAPPVPPRTLRGYEPDPTSSRAPPRESTTPTLTGVNLRGPAEKITPLGRGQESPSSRPTPARTETRVSLRPEPRDSA